MVQARKGLIVTVGFDTAGGYLGDIVYDLAQAAMHRLTLAMAQELKPFGVTALGLSPGHVLTERVRDAGLANRVARRRSMPAAQSRRSCRTPRSRAMRAPCCMSPISPALRLHGPGRHHAVALHRAVMRHGP